MLRMLSSAADERFVCRLHADPQRLLFLADRCVCAPSSDGCVTAADAPPCACTAGTVGFLACLLFVHIIYGSVKID